MSNVCEFPNSFHRAYFIIGMHDAYQGRIVSDSFPKSLGLNLAIFIDG